MLQPGDYFASPRTGAILEITKWPELGGPGALEVRRVLRPGMGFPLPHVHLDMDETFKIEFGVADARVGVRTIRLGVDEEFRVPRYDMHVNPRNRSRTDVVMLHRFESATTYVAQRYIETLAEYIEDGRDMWGDLPPLVALAVFAGRDQQTYGPWLPRGLQRKVVFPLAKSFEDWRDARRRDREELSAEDEGDQPRGWLRRGRPRLSG